jgi:hypothetical protein
MIKITIAILLLILALILFVTPTIVYSESQIKQIVVTSTEPILEVLRPQLVPICACESVGNPNAIPQQFNKDGSVIKGKINPSDIGMCQINLRYWGQKAIDLGFDIYTEQGNIKMANWIYDHQGTSPWIWSRGCHHQ